MTRHTRAPRGAVAAAAVLALAVVAAGCTSQAPPEPTETQGTTGTGDGTPSESPEPTGEAPEGAQPVVREVPVGQRTIEFAVGPLTAQGDLTILPIVATDVGDGQEGEPVAIHALWGGLRPGANGVRLVDPDARTVQEAAEAGGPLYTTGALEVTNAPLAMYVVFGPQTTSAIDVLLPYSGYFPDVPVVPEDEASAEVEQAFADLVPDPAAVTSGVHELDSFAIDVDGEVDTRVTHDEVQININADVLFAVDKASISSAADSVLRRAVRDFDFYSAGTLEIVGHTDDVGPDDYNQELSERRADAVAERFASLTDTSRYEVVVEGRGEREPRASGTSAEARSLNRRVEVVFRPAEGAESERSTDSADDGPVPDSQGPTATGPEGVVLEGTNGELRVTLPEVERRGDLLVGEVELTHVAGDVGLVGEWFAVGSAANLRGSFQPDQQYAPANLTLLAGGQRFFAMDYVRGGEDLGDKSRPLVDLNMSAALPAGTYVATVVWPDVTNGGGDAVTLDVHNPSDEEAHRKLRPPFRLTDIPVVG